MIREAIDICVEEVALSGLEGAPLKLIWIRLQQRMPDFDLTDPVKECLWQQLVLRSAEERGRNIDFYTNPYPIKINVLFDDAYWSDPINSTKHRLYIPLPNAWKVVKNERTNLLGCCQYYKEREDITQLIQESNLSYSEVVDKFGDYLTVVGSQDLREYHLNSPMMDPGWMKWTTKDYSLLEMVGKSREHGIMRHILNTSYAAEQSGTKAFHVIKDLRKLGFLILEEVNYKNDGHIINGTLIRLIKYKHCLSAAVSSQNKDKAGVLYFLDGLAGKFATKKVLRAKYGTEMVESVAAKGMISSIRLEDRMCYKLAKPISQLSKELMDDDLSDEEYTSEGDEKDELEDTAHARHRVNYHRDSTLFLQYYKAVHDAGPGGVHLQDVVKSFSINHLISRRIPVSLENAGLIVSKLEDMHHTASNKLIRKYRLTASCYLEGRGRAKNLDSKTHKKKEHSRLPLSQSTPSSRSLTFSPSANVDSVPSTSTSLCLSTSSEQMQTQTKGASEQLDATVQSMDWNSEDMYDESSYQDSSHLDTQEIASLSEESENEEDCSGPDPPVVPLEKLKAENGGVVFSEREINEFIASLRERFDSPRMEVRLTYLDPDIQARKQQSTLLYERRKSDLCGYLRQKRVVIDKVAMRYFLQSKDMDAGMLGKMDLRTLYRNLSQLQLQGFLHQFLFQVKSDSGDQLEDKIYLYYPEPLSSSKMLERSQALLIRMSDKLTWKRDSQDKDYSLPVQMRDTSRQFPALPKFQKLRALHLYFHLLAYGHELDLSTFKDIPFSWLDKVKKLPELDTHGPGWINTAIALRYIPFSLFYALGAQIAEYAEYLSEAVGEIFSDPTKRDLPRALINIDKLGSGVLSLKKGHVTRYREMLLQLYKIGAIEIDGATIPGVLKSVDMPLNLELVHIYIKPSLTLVDTCREAHGCRHTFFTNEARDYLPAYEIHLDTIADLDHYWLLAEMISINSKLDIKSDGRRRKKKKEEFSIEVPRDVKKMDSRKIDSLAFGAAGFVPTLWSNVKRNWISQCDPPDPGRCYFDYSCRSLAYKATNVLTQEPKKSDSTLDRLIPQPKLLLSQKGCLLKSSKDRREKRRIKQRKQQVRRPFWSNMYTFIRANFKAPEEAGLVRKSLTRCAHWSEQESNTLLLCYIASVVLIQLLGRQVSTMVDIMGVLEETSKDKTTSTIRRHLRRVIKLNPVLISYCDSSIQEVYNELKTSDSEEHTFKQIFEHSRKTLTNSPAEVIKGDFKANALLLPHSIEELHQNYSVRKIDLYDEFIPKVETSSHKNENTIKAFILSDMIVSSVSMFSGTSFGNYSAFMMFNRFPLNLLKQVVSKLKQNQILSKNREIASGDIMRYKIKFLTQVRLSECFPSNSMTFEPQLIPYKLSDLSLYSDDPHSSQTLVTTLTEDIMLASPGDCLSLLTNLHSQKNNFRFDVDFPYRPQKSGEESGVQFLLSQLERAHRPDGDHTQLAEQVGETGVDRMRLYISTSRHFGFRKTDVMKCADIITLAVTDPWREIEFETIDLPPHCSSPSEGAGDAMSWKLYAQLVGEHLHFSQSDLEFSKQLYEEICCEMDLGVREIELIQKYPRSRERGESTEVLLQNLVNFRLVMRAGTIEPCLIAMEFAEIWSHPIMGLDSEQTTHEVHSLLEKQCITCFRPWLGLIGSYVGWNTGMLNQLTRSIHSCIATHNGISELKLLYNLNGFCQLRHLRDILQTLVDSGFIRRTVLERIGGETGKPTLLSKPPTYTSRLSFESSNRDPGSIFYESIPGKDLTASELMLEET